MKSMTGYAALSASNEFFRAEIEIKGYNSRFLDISVFLPQNYICIENDIRMMAGRVCRRGKVDINIKIKETEEAVPVCVNKAAAEAYIKAAALLRPEETLPLAALFTLEGVIEKSSPPAPSKELQAALKPFLEKALAQFDGERAREGEDAKRSILEYVSILNAQISGIKALSPAVDALIKKNIASRFNELLGDRVDEQRVLAETAALLMKWTIAEELSRLQGHLEAFSAGMETEGASKKLEFLCQEMNREINTIGSKTPLVEVSRAVVNCKEALENIREQLRNVE